MRNHNYWKTWNEYQKLYKYRRYWTDNEYQEKIRKYNLSKYYEKKILDIPYNTEFMMYSYFYKNKKLAIF